jgi:hypothetical protein
MVKKVFSTIGLLLLAVVVYPAMVIHTAYKVWYFKHYLLSGKFTHDRENGIERTLQRLTRKSN